MVAGSNPVSPTEFVQIKSHFYLLPLLAARGALDSVSTTLGIAASLPGAKQALTCVFVQNLTSAWRDAVTREL